ncbi:MAG TPA: T9SS type A sorting domain-containing protein [Saprospiraceae bacterium]|nr:T9SS type A sorting domain-containing protein [Saprospiraceae bacterium]
MNLKLIIFLLIGSHCIAQDTVKVQTFTWDSNSRRSVFQFPNDPNASYRKILMKYNMRCHDAAVGVGSVGCREWDYSCNTFITDSSRYDSLLAFNDSYVISRNTGSYFEFQNKASQTYYRTTQRKLSFNQLISENVFQLHSPQSIVYKQINSDRFRHQTIIKASDLIASGVKPGVINGLKLSVKKGGTCKNFKIKIKESSSAQLNSIDSKSLIEYYYLDTEWKDNEQKKLYFYKNYNWNGSSNLLIDISYSNDDQVPSPEFAFNSNNSDALSLSDPDYCMVWDGLSAEIQSPKLNQFNSEITIAFWLFGTPQFQPTNGSVLEAVDDQNRRQLNIHLPWSNGGVYFDCGNNGNYDRIEKSGTTQDFKSQWNFWSFTKNTTDGTMKIYKNGSLWQQGSSKSIPMNFNKLRIGEALTYDGPYFGRMKQLSIWNKELDSIGIQSIMNQDIQPNHPQRSQLIFYYKMNQIQNGELIDDAPSPFPLKLVTDVQLYKDKAERSNLNFTADNSISFELIQGLYSSISVDTVNVIDSVPDQPRKILAYSVVNNDLKLDSVFYLYRGGLLEIYDENGTKLEELILDSDGSLDIEKLTYFRKLPAKYELLSLVTPYGNNLDLGISGKTFVFDVSDFAPILKGKKLLSMELGGENQEEIDIQFLFIKGQPEREIIDIRNIWPFDRAWFSQLLDQSKFEARSTNLNPLAKYHNIRLSITGHEQNGEFTNRKHFINVKGNNTNKFSFNVWKECAFNPIYPQGGTWIFDRAGWCPGAPSDLQRFDISNLVSQGGSTSFDYGVDPPQLDQANYLVSSQLVSYGEFKTNLDASLENIIRPNIGRVEFERLNPACGNPRVQIRNSGKQTITSILIEYGRASGKKDKYEWSGTINPANDKIIDLPYPTDEFWMIAQDTVFEVRILNVNQNVDENKENNFMSTLYRNVDVYPQTLFFEFRSNNIPAESSYKIVNSKGQTVIERTSFSAATVYRDELNLAPDCYTLYVNDSGHDGLYFWFYPNNGSGSARIVKKMNSIFLPVRGFNPDFGGGFQYDFRISSNVGSQNLNPFSLFSVNPNPVSDLLEVNFKSNIQGAAQIYILDVSGRVVYEETIDQSNKLSFSQIPVQHLHSGLYFIKLTQAGYSKTTSFIKQ